VSIELFCGLDFSLDLYLVDHIIDAIWEEPVSVVKYSDTASNFCAGKTRARDAALNAIQSPLLDIGIQRATGIVWNITGGTDLTLFEVCPFHLS